MPPLGELHARRADGVIPALPGAVRAMPLRIARAANDNHRIHAPWRRFVAATMAVMFAASLILVGLVCIARAAEPAAWLILGN